MGSEWSDLSRAYIRNHFDLMKRKKKGISDKHLSHAARMNMLALQLGKTVK